ncbi:MULTISPECIES: DUF2190 family protein [Arcobacteraceae]|uniref:DUF2190 family protein n=1 Tax=Arcobacteraceae TaxID=2808963 RepID=UPI00100BBEC4|nr:DUF2190 family protein [Arcobacter sp. CECT 8989]RXK03792.1 hypothetical protein CRV02_00945 [Arcobacter sp. CECT 8989]
MAKQAIEKQEGRIIDHTLTADVNVGDVIAFDGMVGVAVTSGLTGEVVAVELEKVWTMNAKTADTITVGTKLYWDDTNEELTVTDTSNTYAGKAVSTKAGSTAGIVDIKLNA